MIIAYLHGYNSYYDSPKNDKVKDKVKALKRLGRVVGLGIDYNVDGAVVIDEVCDWAIKEDVDLVVGCSMGGWLASHVGSRLGVPAVMLNPVISPSISLKKYIEVPEGELDYGGYPMRAIDRSVVEAYPAISKKAWGLVLLEKGDNVLNYKNSESILSKYYKVIVSDGGSHRYESLEDRLEDIEYLVEIAGLNYGSGKS
tara:strand:+ start:707 stop:1303 length:597 start_codon:yes stop_codon:yes gene_type:complete